MSAQIIPFPVRRNAALDVVADILTSSIPTPTNDPGTNALLAEIDRAVASGSAERMALAARAVEAWERALA